MLCPPSMKLVRLLLLLLHEFVSHCITALPSALENACVNTLIQCKIGKMCKSQIPTLQVEKYQGFTALHAFNFKTVSI